MARTVKQIVREVMHNISREDLWDEVVDLINDMQKELERKHEFRDLETRDLTTLTCTAGADTVSLTGVTDLHTVKSLLLVSGVNTRELETTTLEDLNDRFPNRASTASGRPLFAAQWGSRLYLSCPASVAFPIYVYYLKWSTALTDTDTLPISHSDQAMIAMATYGALLRGWGNGVGAAQVDVWRREASALVESLIKGDMARVRPRPLEFATAGGVPPDYYANPFISSVEAG